jgi:hypothetical protein
MVQPVQPRSFEGSLDLEGPPLSRQPASGPPPAVRDPSQIPDLGHLTGSPSGLTIRPRPSAAAPGQVVATAARGAGPSNAAAIQRRLDAFLAAARPTYHTPEGDAQVSTPFRMAGGYPAHEAAVVLPNDAELQAAATSVRMTPGEVKLVKDGRGTCGQVRQLTQALIDAGKLPSSASGASLADRIRQMMFDHGIGMDCASYVRQALVAAYPGASSAQWRAPINEDLSGLANRGFVRLPMSDVQVGDIIVLKPPTPQDYGHTVIVHDARQATDADQKSLEKLVQRSAEAIMISRSDAVRVFELDSSWGCGGIAANGGARRTTFYEDQLTGRWLKVESDQTLTVSSSLYGHEVEGVYRLAWTQ